MKHLLILVMINSLLFAAVGCSNDLGSHQEHETELPGEEEPAEITAQAPDNAQERTYNQETVSQEIENSVTETPENETPVIKTPEEKAPTEETPETEPQEENDPEVILPETEPPIVVQPVIALLEINELKTDFSSTLFYTEYVEFKVKRAGNLKGISLNIMNDAKNPFIYFFPDINVNLGEYITLHLRTYEKKCIDELGDNLSLSGGIEACPTARDLWVAGSDEYLKKTDIIYLQDANGNIFDAVVLNQNPSNSWNKDQSHFAGITEKLYNAGVWKAADGKKPTPLDAINTSSIGSSVYKSISRHEEKENTHTANDWYITASGYSTPGKPNK